METNGGSKHERLREAGIIRQDDLPEAYADVVEGLTPYEIEILIAVKKRLQSADARDLGRTPGPDEETRFMTFIQF